MASNQFDSQASTNYKEAFALFDKRGNGRVTVDSLGDLLRACGQNPTLAEISDLEKNAGNECEWTVPFCSCVAVLWSRSTAAGRSRAQTIALLMQNAEQSISRPFSESSTALAASGTLANPPSTAVVSRFSTRT